MDEITGQVLRQLLSALKCTLCGRSYHEIDIKVLAHKDAAWFINVKCSFCGSRNLVAAVVKQTGNTPVVTDLTATESTRFTDTHAVDANDVLSIHYFLEGFDGDFSKPFNSFPPNPVPSEREQFLKGI